MNTQTMHAYAELLQLGFARTDTGGGCTALTRRYPDNSYHLITVEGDPIAPDENTPDDAMVRVGLYNDGEFEPTADDFADTLAGATATFRESALQQRSIASRGALTPGDVAATEQDNVIQTTVRCGWCGGSGVLATDEDCEECGGTGEVEVTP